MDTGGAQVIELPLQGAIIFLDELAKVLDSDVGAKRKMTVSRFMVDEWHEALAKFGIDFGYFLRSSKDEAEIVKGFREQVAIDHDDLGKLLEAIE